MSERRINPVAQKRNSQKSGWRKGPFCCTDKARKSHQRYLDRASATRGDRHHVQPGNQPHDN